MEPGRADPAVADGRGRVRDVYNRADWRSTMTWAKQNPIPLFAVGDIVPCFYRRRLSYCIIISIRFVTVKVAMSDHRKRWHFIETLADIEQLNRWVREYPEKCMIAQQLSLKPEELL